MIFHFESVPLPPLPPRGLKPRRVHRRYHVPNARNNDDQAQRIPLSSPTFQHFFRYYIIYICGQLDI